jgi:AraC-like DNA-binding protein
VGTGDAGAKVERLKERLLPTGLTLDEVVDHTGFASAYYLCHVFKRWAHTTPGRYRAEQRRR